MLDRRWFGDLGLAILLAMPIATLALPLPASNQPKISQVTKAAPADRIVATGRIGLLG